MSGHAQYELFKDDAGEYRHRLRAANGEIVQQGTEGYRDPHDADRGIQDAHAAALQAVQPGEFNGKPRTVAIDPSTW